jgi:PAS domain S-box-containing protein
MSNTPLSNMDASLRSYSEFVRNLPVAVYRVTIEGKIAFCNDPFARIFGFASVNDAIGFPEIKLYRNKKDRGTLVQAVLQRGLISEMPVPFSRCDQAPIWCSVTTKAIFDDDGEVVFLDGLVRDITGEIEEAGANDASIERLEKIKEAIFLFDPKGVIIEANKAAAEMIGCNLAELPGRQFSDFLASEDRQFFFLFLGDTIRIGREEIILKIGLSSSKEQFVRIQAAVVKSEGRSRKINCVVRDVTERIKQIKEKTNRDKFQGVLEMAGGVAHRFNQPLTIVNNIINETLSGIEPDDRLYASILKMQAQIHKLNDITKKVGNIKKYEAVDYVAGVKIVDIDKAS